MKRNLGISIYPDHSNSEEDMEYMEHAAQYGFKRIFISMLEVNDNRQVVKEKFKKIISFANQLGFETILDVSPNIFDKLKISYDDLKFFHELGATGIRLDASFDGNKEAMLTYNPYSIVIELNMSNDVAYLDNILTFQANTPFLYGCHNFYPQDGTGLSYDFFEKCSKRFKNNGIKTAAFITSQVGKIGPWDINDGLPTLEEHRYLPSDVAAKHLFATNLIDDVIIGNAYASKEELRLLGNINRYLIELKIDLVSDINDVERDILLNELHYRRGGINSNFIRSTNVRKLYSEVSNNQHDNLMEFQIGDVVVGNDKFGKYKNELQIVLTPHKDSRKNKVGNIVNNELLLIDYIHPWTKFKFVNNQ